MQEKKQEQKKNNGITAAIIVVILLAVVLLFFLLGGCSRKYTVEFDTNGGSIVDPMKIEKDGTIEKPTDPTKEGYIFAGWYLNDELFDFTTPITGNITLEARWNASGIVLEKSNLNLVIGLNQKIEFASLPEGITSEDLVYEIGDESIAVVDQNGNVKAIKAGTTTITIKSKDGKYSTQCTLVVTNEKIDIESLTIAGASSLTVGKSIKLSVSVIPENATSGKLTWKSSDPSIASVDQNGNVKGIKEGTVTITVTTENGKTATKKITINKATSTTTDDDDKEINPTSVEISGKQEVYIGESIKLSATVKPKNATNKNVTWESSDPSVASVDKNGNVKGIKEGTVTITVTTENGKTATYTVTVKEKEASYVIYLKQNKLGNITSDSIQYDFSVTKDGNPFTDYLGFEYNGTRVAKEQGTVPVTAVGNGGTAKLTLSNKKVVTATVVVS